MALARLHIEGNRYGVRYPDRKKVVWCKDYSEASARLDRANTPKVKPKKKGKK